MLKYEFLSGSTYSYCYGTCEIKDAVALNGVQTRDIVLRGYNKYSGAFKGRALQKQRRPKISSKLPGQINYAVSYSTYLALDHRNSR